MSKLAKIKQVVGTAVSVPGDDVDTDRIIPARFLKCVTFDGLGKSAFYDVRFNEDGSSRGHPIDDPKFKGADILLVGANFGCGSSREHAPQALSKHGFKAIIGLSFAEIFFGNSTTLGIPCVAVSKQDQEVLQQQINKNPQAQVTVDVEKLIVLAGDQEYQCKLVESARSSLIRGEWDPIAQMLDKPEQIDAVAEKLAYVETV